MTKHHFKFDIGAQVTIDTDGLKTPDPSNTDWGVVYARKWNTETDSPLYCVSVIQGSFDIHRNEDGHLWLNESEMESRT